MEQLSRELEGVRQDIKEQQQELKAAVEAKKPELVIATIREEKTRLVARQQRLEDQLGALQAQQAGPAGFKRRKVGDEEPGMPTGAMEADPAMKAFWQNLHAAEMKQQIVSVPLDPEETPILVEVTTLKLAGGTKFMGLDEGLSSILIPDSYCKLWEEVAPLLEKRRASTAKPADNAAVKFIYTGTLGIGKSVAGWYFMYELRRRYGSEVDVVYQSERSKCQYLFEGSGEVRSVKTAHGSFDKHMARPSTVYMVDGAGVEEVKAPTFVFCSPDKKKNYGEYRKGTGVDLRYLPVWSLQQLLVARQLFYQHVSVDRVRELYAMWGGVPRVVLEKANDESYQCNDMLKAFDKYPRFNDILASVGALDAPDAFSSKILHFAVAADSIHNHVVFASQWVADTLVSRAGQQAEAEIRNFLAAQEHNRQAAGMRGQVFECFAHKQLQRGGKFTVRDLSDNGHAAAAEETWDPMRYQEFSSVTEVSGSPAALYMVPRAKNNKAFDAVRPPKDALQMTVSACHPISQNGLLELLEAMPTLQRLIFVVPLNIFKVFKAQQLVSSGSIPHVLEITRKKVRAVKQYALVLPITCEDQKQVEAMAESRVALSIAK